MKRIALFAAFAVVAGANGQAFNIVATGNVPIPDSPGAEVLASFLVGTVGTIARLDRIDIIIQHTWQGDLRVRLIAPDLTSLLLMDRPGQPQTGFGFSADNFGNFTTGVPMDFGDAGATTYDAPQVAGVGIANVTGMWDAEGGSVQAFGAGKALNGIWSLAVQDFAGGDVGAIRQVSLHGTLVPEPGSMIALGAGVAALLARRRRKA